MASAAPDSTVRPPLPKSTTAMSLVRSTFVPYQLTLVTYDYALTQIVTKPTLCQTSCPHTLYVF